MGLVLNVILFPPYLFWLPPLVIRRMHRLYIHVGLEQRDKKAEKKKTKLLTMKGGTAATDHAFPPSREGDVDVGADRTRPLA